MKDVTAHPTRSCFYAFLYSKPYIFILVCILFEILLRKQGNILKAGDVVMISDQY